MQRLEISKIPITQILEDGEKCLGLNPGMMKVTYSLLEAFVPDYKPKKLFC